MEGALIEIIEAGKDKESVREEAADATEIADCPSRLT